MPAQHCYLAKCVVRGTHEVHRDFTGVEWTVEDGKALIHPRENAAALGGVTEHGLNALIDNIGKVEAALRRDFDSSYVRRHAHDMAITALKALADNYGE